MLHAVAMRTDWQKSNTRVEIKCGGDCACVYLHGNLIAVKDYIANAWHYCHCGWRTCTTRSRLNALGANIIQRNWVWMVARNGQEFVSEDLYAVITAIRQRRERTLQQQDHNLFAA